MTVSIKAQLAGLDDVLKRLKGVAEAVETKALAKGVDAACDVIVRAAQAKLETDTGLGLLKKSLGKKRKKYGSRQVGVVGPRVGFGTQIGVRKRDGKKSKKGDPIYEDPAKIGHLVEFGHGAPHPAPPHPFLRSALDESGPAATAALSDAVREVLDQG